MLNLKAKKVFPYANSLLKIKLFSPGSMYPSLRYWMMHRMKRGRTISDIKRRSRGMEGTFSPVLNLCRLQNLSMKKNTKINKWYINLKKKKKHWQKRSIFHSHSFMFAHLFLISWLLKASVIKMILNKYDNNVNGFAVIIQPHNFVRLLKWFLFSKSCWINKYLPIKCFLTFMLLT